MFVAFHEIFIFPLKNFLMLKVQVLAINNCKNSRVDQATSFPGPRPQAREKALERSR